MDNIDNFSKELGDKYADYPDDFVEKISQIEQEILAGRSPKDVLNISDEDLYKFAYEMYNSKNYSYANGIINFLCESDHTKVKIFLKLAQYSKKKTTFL